MKFTHFNFLNQDRLPLIIQPECLKQGNINYLIQFLKDENAVFKEQLLCYGAVLLRGFHIHLAEHLALVINTCNLGSPFDYGSGLIPRTKINAEVHMITNAHEGNIPMHNEKSYSNDFPHHLYFNCISAAKKGGNTPLADSHRVWSSLPDEVQHKLFEKGILYHKFYYGNSIKQKYAQVISGGIGCEIWMSAFQTESKSEVEHALNKRQISFRWLDKINGLITEEILPAARQHPMSNKVVWFNQSSHMNYYCNYTYGVDRSLYNSISRLLLPAKRFLTRFASYGDGEPISKSDSYCINQAIQINKISIPWQEGDVMVVDNYLCMHGKESHSGERLILVGMTHSKGFGHEEEKNY